MEHPDFIYHLAALPRIQPSFEFPALTMEIGLLGTMNILEWAKEKDCKVVFAGSSSVHSGKLENPYTFSKDFGVSFQSSNVFSNLCGDQNYTIIVKDDNGCVFSDSITLVEPTELSFDVSTSNYNGYAVSCNGAQEGNIDIYVSGGTGVFTYSWSSGETTQDISGLVAGTYQLTVTDSNNCQIFDSGTSLSEDGKLLTNGGRVLSAVSYTHLTLPTKRIV